MEERYRTGQELMLEIQKNIFRKAMSIEELNSKIYPSKKAAPFYNAIGRIYWSIDMFIKMGMVRPVMENSVLKFKWKENGGKKI